MSSLEGALESTAPSTSSQHVNKNTEEDGEDLVGNIIDHKPTRLYRLVDITNFKAQNVGFITTAKTRI